MSEAEDTFDYTVVVNREEQYSIWPAHRDLPLGWTAVNFTGTKQACLDYIDSVWTEQIPSSVRKAIREMRELREREEARFHEAMQNRD